MHLAYESTLPQRPLGRRILSRLFHAAVGAALLVAPVACGDGDEDPALHCDRPEDQVEYVYAAMREYYLWADAMPEVDLADYESPQALLNAVRYEHDRWSAVFPAPELKDFYAGRSIGLGFRMMRVADQDGSTRLRVALVYEDSPAMRAGLQRGMTLLEINGKTIEAIDAEQLWGTILGPDEVGVQAALRVAEVDGTERVITATKAELTRTSVFLTEVVPVGDLRVGYIMFEQFINPSQAALQVAFEELKAEQATDLVLDLRYNTGGLLDVTRYLASLIAGPEHEEDVFLRFDYNERQQRLNQIMTFGSYTESIGFDRAAFLVSGNTASASEALINGLRPYMDVHLVGFNTLGKPVGSHGFDFCEMTLQPITFALNNVHREGSYFQGLPPDCSMDDDLDHQLGDPAEARFAAAISWLRGEPCPDLVPNASGALALPNRTLPVEKLVQGPGVAGYYGVF